MSCGRDLAGAVGQVECNACTSGLPVGYAQGAAQGDTEVIGVVQAQAASPAFGGHEWLTNMGSDGRWNSRATIKNRDAQSVTVSSGSQNDGFIREHGDHGLMGVVEEIGKGLREEQPRQKPFADRRVGFDHDWALMDGPLVGHLLGEQIGAETLEPKSVGVQPMVNHGLQDRFAVPETLTDGGKVGIGGGNVGFETSETEAYNIQWRRELMAKSRCQKTRGSKPILPRLGDSKGFDDALALPQRSRQPSGQSPNEEGDDNVGHPLYRRVSDRCAERRGVVRKPRNDADEQQQQSPNGIAPSASKNQRTQAGVDQGDRCHRVVDSSGHDQKTAQNKEVHAHLSGQSPRGIVLRFPVEKVKDKVESGQSDDQGQIDGQVVGFEPASRQGWWYDRDLSRDGNPAQPNKPQGSYRASVGSDRTREGRTHRGLGSDFPFNGGDNGGSLMRGVHESSSPSLPCTTRKAAATVQGAANCCATECCIVTGEVPGEFVGQGGLVMSSNTGRHGSLSFEPDQAGLSNVHRFIVGITLFVVASLIGVNWWLDRELSRVSEVDVFSER